MRVESAPKGKFKFVEEYKDPMTGHRKRFSVTLDKNTRATRKQAQKLLEAKIEEFNVNSRLTNDNITFGELVNEWLPRYHQTVKESTYMNRAFLVNDLLRIIGRTVIVSKLSTFYITKKIETELYNHQINNRKAKKLLTVLRLVMRYARHNGYITDIPVPASDQVNWVKETLKDNEPQFMDEQELDSILAYLHQHFPYTAVICEWQYLTGMRFGEAAAIQVKDIQQINGKWIAKVNGTLFYLQGVKNYRKSSTPKTKSSIRDVTLPPKAIQIFKDLSQDKQAENFLFLNQRGQPLSIHTVTSNLKTAREALNIKKRVTTHTFRHTHISKLAELGVPLYVIQKRVGHASEAITKKIYLHVTKKAEEEMENKLKHL